MSPTSPTQLPPAPDGGGGSGGSFLVVLLAVFCGLGVVLAASGMPLSQFLDRQVTAAHAESAATGWEFAPTAVAELGTVAIQVCSGEVALKAATDDAEKSRREARLAELGLEYDRLAAVYNNELKLRVSAGNQRPWDIPAAAPPLSVMKGRACAKLPAVVVATQPEAFSIEPDQQRLTPEQLDAAAVAAGWPMENGWWPQMRQIVWCESGNNRFAHNRSDPNGGSYGLAQLNGRQHFDKAGEDFELRFDPVVNLRTALWLRTVRGHFGGFGGWKICSERYGIP